MAQFFTWLLVIFGWVVVHYLSDVRAIRAEIRQLSEKTIEDIIAIRDMAIDFHKSSDFGVVTSKKILFAIEDTSRRLQQKPLSNIQVANLFIMRFRQSITLNNFDKTSFNALSEDSEIISKIIDSSDILISDIEEQYARRYLSNWKQLFRI